MHGISSGQILSMKQKAIDRYDYDISYSDMYDRAVQDKPINIYM